MRISHAKHLLITLWGASLLLLHGLSLGHAEHDKPRYVADTGQDEGRCDKPDQPCKTIGYAASQASKGDRILVAGGSYTIEDVDTLFYLVGNLVPVKGGHAPGSFKQDQENHPSRLLGVPPEYAEDLAARGFLVIVDRKGIRPELETQLAEKLEIRNALAQKQRRIDCQNGRADQFPCHRVDLVAHLPLSAMSSTQGNDIWGHYDLNTGREYALMGLVNGTAIVDISIPDQPRLISRIPGQNTTWRDIKVLQTWSASEQRWKAWAYVTADNASLGLQIIDLNELPERASLAATDTTDLSAHNVYMSNVDYSTGVPLTGMTPYLHIAGSDKNGGAFNSYSLDNPLDPAPVYRHSSDARANYSHDVASLVITDERKSTQCVNGGNHCEILLDYNEDDIRLWDKTLNQNPVELSRTIYPNMAYVHSGWWTEDKQFMSVHDELDEQFFGINTTVRFFDISDLRNPQLLGTYTGPTRAIDHNGFARGNRYYVSNYERGLVILDITDPTQPTEAGFFDTYPLSNLAAFNGAWGVYPFLPSGLILVSDINSGLYILRDQTLDVPQGKLSFTSPSYSAEEGGQISLGIARTGGTQDAISVAYETQVGSAGTSDFTSAQGRIHWAAGESWSKAINIAIASDDLDEFDERFFVRLYDPQGGTTLATPNLVQVTIEGRPDSGRLVFSPATLSLREDQGPVSLSLNRVGGAETDIQAELLLPGDVPLSLDKNTLTWEADDRTPQTILITPSYDPQASGDRLYTLSLAGEPGTALSAQLPITLRDKESNLPPAITPLASRNAIAGSQLSLQAQASDPEGFPLTYQWTQVSGTQVSLGGAQTPTLSFTSPAQAGELGFRLEVTDDFGASSHQEVSVNVTAAASSSAATGISGGKKSGGSPTSAWVWVLLVLLIPKALAQCRRMDRRHWR